LFPKNLEQKVLPVKQTLLGTRCQRSLKMIRKLVATGLVLTGLAIVYGVQQVENWSFVYASFLLAYLLMFAGILLTLKKRK